MNTLAKHTLGPWRIGDAGKTVFGPFTASPCPVTVAKMPEASPRCGAGERKANAQLIAAAPEMAEALGMALESLDETNVPQEWDCRHKIRAALRKAGLLS